MSRFVFKTACAMAVHAALAAAAAAAPAPDPQEGGSSMRAAALDEVVVTAQRREATLESTPVAVAVLDPTVLQDKAIVTELDLQTAVAGLTVKAGQSANQLNYSIRGQTVDSFSSSRPSVLPYFNEIQVGGSASTAFYDLESIQVLKGPQGTLFGRNSTGGAVLLTTARPRDEAGGYFSVWAGDYDEFKAEGAVNFAVVEDKALVRLAGFFQSHDGYQYNLFSQSRLGNTQRANARFSLTLRPTDTFSNDLVIDYGESKGNNLSSVAYTTFEIGEGNPFVPANFLYSPLVDTAFGPGAWDAFLAAHPGADPEGWVASIKKQQARGPHTVDVDGPNFHLARNLLVSNVTTVELSEGLKLRGILGYTRIRSSNASEFDGTPFPADDNGEEGRGGTLEQFSAELQLAGETAGGLSYVTGLYYSDEDDDTRSLSVLFDLLPAAPPVLQINDGVVSNETAAIYAQGTLDISGWTGVDGLSFTLGGRYSEEDVQFLRNPDDTFIANPPPPGAVFVNPLEDTFKQFSWTVGLDYQATDEWLLYLVSRRSFRSGGFNYFAPPLEGFGNDGGAEYEEERATDIEAGAKFAGSLGGMPVRLNLAAYKMWIDDIQRSNYVAIFGALAGITVNVPEAQIYGFEFDGEVKPTNWLSVGGSLTYTNAEFTDNVVSVLGNPAVAFGPYPDTPEWSAAAYADVRLPLNDRFDLAVRADVYHQTSNFFSSTGNTLNPGTEIPEYTVANLRVALENPDSGWSFAAHVKNAFDETYYVGGIGFASLFAVNTVIPGAPRTWMIEARRSF